MTQLTNPLPDDGDDLVARLERVSAGHLPGLLGVEIISAGPGELRSRLPLGRTHLAGNGYLHAGTVVTLADTSAGYGCQSSLPEGAGPRAA